uniref:Uncharacterized protein n=1 Tax=Arundo donax TaxID=35708 RepID=A0A0A9CE98_ARUDO
MRNRVTLLSFSTGWSRIQKHWSQGLSCSM